MKETALNVFTTINILKRQINYLVPIFQRYNLKAIHSFLETHVRAPLPCSTLQRYNLSS